MGSPSCHLTAWHSEPEVVRSVNSLQMLTSLLGIDTAAHVKATIPTEAKSNWKKILICA